MTTDPADFDAVTARRLIGRKALSPVDLAEACLARIDALDPAVNAVVAMDREGLLAAARQAETAVQRGAPLPPLHGLPLLVKDMEDVAGLPTTRGSPLFANHRAAGDTPLVAACRAAGALPFAKTNVPEFAAGANTANPVHGATGNAHDPTRSAAGSSGGSAVGLACGMAPLATGSDLGGSLRIPAAYNGVTGFRPSPGLVPDPDRAHGLLPLWTSGAMARSVPDLALLLSVMARHDARDPFSWADDGTRHALADLPRRDLSGLRVAVTPDFGFAPTSREVRALFDRATAALAPHFATVDTAHPDSREANRIFSVLRAVTFLTDFPQRVARFPDAVGPNVTANVREGQGYAAADVAEALHLQSRFARRWHDFFAEWDLLLSPVVALQPQALSAPPPSEIDGAPLGTYYGWLGQAYAVTVAGHPAVSIPCGRDADGLPFGLQIVGPRRGDVDLLACAAEIARVIAGDADLRVPAPDFERLRAARSLRPPP